MQYRGSPKLQDNGHTGHALASSAGVMQVCYGFVGVGHGGWAYGIPLGIQIDQCR